MSRISVFGFWAIIQCLVVFAYLHVALFIHSILRHCVLLFYSRAFMSQQISFRSSRFSWIPALQNTIFWPVSLVLVSCTRARVGHFLFAHRPMVYYPCVPGISFILILSAVDSVPDLHLYSIFISSQELTL